MYHDLEEIFDGALASPVIEATPSYLSLYLRQQFYGGPEEGGWWGYDVSLVKYRRYPARELAERDLATIEKVAEDASREAKLEWGRQCQRECDDAEARGIEPADLPETDGPDDYFVVVEDQPGESESRGDRRYM